MIKRHYFMHMKKNWDDGSGSFSWEYYTFTMRSWFPDPQKAFYECLMILQSKVEDKPGYCEVTAFNRI